MLKTISMQRNAVKKPEGSPRSLSSPKASLRATPRSPADHARLPTKNRKPFVFCFVIVVSAIFFPIVYLLLTRLGLGSRFPEQAKFIESKPLLDESALEIVAELPVPPGNIAVSDKGRIFFNFHPEYEPSIKVAELKDKTTFVAYPSVEYQENIKTCLSLRIDRQQRLWLLDYAFHGIKGTPQLTAFDISGSDNAIVHQYSFPKTVAGFGSMLNDFQVDPSGEYIYLVDTSIVGNTPSLIVYSLVHGRSHRILSEHPSMFGKSTFFNVAGTKVGFGPFGLKLHVDSVVLDRRGSQLYYGAVGSPNLYTISTSHLLYYVHRLEADATSQEVLDHNLGEYVQLVSTHKPATDGLSIDGSDNVYLTCIERSAIALAQQMFPLPNRNDPASPPPAWEDDKQPMRVVKLVSSKSLLRWPDGLSFGPDGLYITNSALHLKFSHADIPRNAPYHILRIRSEHLKRAVVTPKGAGMVMPPAGH